MIEKKTADTRIENGQHSAWQKLTPLEQVKVKMANRP